MNERERALYQIRIPRWNPNEYMGLVNKVIIEELAIDQAIEILVNKYKR